MWNPRWRLAVAFLLLSAVGLFAVLEWRLGAASSAELAYDRERVAAHVVVLAEEIGVRRAGTANEGRAAAYIASEFVDLGLDTWIHPFRAFDFYSQNVVATAHGTDPDAGTLFIGAHYDSVRWGPGANDNASGTAVLLEAARIFAGESLSPTITFVAFGAEERSLGGSGAFVRTISPLERLRSRAMINMDCIGWGTQQGISVIGEADQVLADRVLAVASDLGRTLGVDDSANSDHAWFSLIGIPSVALYTHDPDEVNLCGPYYHQAGDTPDTLDPAQMEAVATVLLSTVRELAADPVTPLHQVWVPLVQGSR